MAKNRNAGAIRQAKLRDNRAPMLICSTRKCECEFYVSYPNKPNGTHKRFCHGHAPFPEKTPQERKPRHNQADLLERVLALR